MYHLHWGISPHHQVVLDELFQIIDAFTTSNEFILCGDVNGLRSHMGGLYSTHNLHQIINFPTRGESTLNIFATTSPESSDNSCMLQPLGKSDHVGYFLRKLVHSKNYTIKKVQIRTFNPSTSSLCRGQNYVQQIGMR